MCDGRLLTPALFPSPSEARHAVAKDRNHNPPKTKKKFLRPCASRWPHFLCPTPHDGRRRPDPSPCASRRPPPPGSFTLRLTPAAARILRLAPQAGRRCSSLAGACRSRPRRFSRYGSEVVRGIAASLFWDAHRSIEGDAAAGTWTHGAAAGDLRPSWEMRPLPSPFTAAARGAPSHIVAPLPAGVGAAQVP
jgi:hypothetical protein